MIDASARQHPFTLIRSDSRSSTMSNDENSEDDYDFSAEHDLEKRYPLHDCCEFEDVEALRVRKSAEESWAVGNWWKQVHAFGFD